MADVVESIFVSYSCKGVPSGTPFAKLRELVCINIKHLSIQGVRKIRAADSADDQQYPNYMAILSKLYLKTIIVHRSGSLDQFSRHEIYYKKCLLARDASQIADAL